MKIQQSMRILLLSSITLVAITAVSAQVPAWVPLEGLVAWYPFNGNTQDESDNSNDGVVNGATLTEDRNGSPNSAYHFAGNINSYIGGSSSNYPDTARSISLWYNARNIAADSPSVVLFGYGGQTCGQSWLQGFHPTGYGLGMHCDENKSNEGVVVDNDSWHHWVITTDGDSSTTFYLDGHWAFDTTNYYSNTIVSDKEFTIGGIPSPTGFDSWADQNVTPIQGDMDNIAIFDRVLSACEILELYYETEFLVSAQPLDVAVLDGDTATFSVGTSIETCITYQWQQDCGFGFADLEDSGSYSGIQSAMLTSAPATLANDGCAYRCVLSACALCTDTSEAATLYVSASSVMEGRSHAILPIFPNPVKDQMILALPGILSHGTELHVLDAMGRVVDRVRPIQGRSLIVHVTHLPSGTYFVTLQGGKWQAHGKFIKQ